MTGSENQGAAAGGGWPAGLSRPALRALAQAGIGRLEEAAGWREDELGKLHGMGPKGIRLLREALAEAGLAFADRREP